MGQQGFTIIELLVVLIIIGILAAAGSTGIGRTRAQGHVAVMKADLRAIAVSQEAYFEDQILSGNTPTYASTVADLAHPTSPGIVVELTGNPTGWAARTTHPGATGHRCAMFRGTIAPYAPATLSGRLACD